MTMVDTRRVRVGRTVARWTIELVVVFVGVYAAFALGEWEEERERDRRARQVRDALAEEIRGIQQNTRGVAETMPRMLRQMDSAMAAGETPRLQPMLEPIRVESHVWDATVQSGGLGLLDVETFYTVSEFYNLLNAGFVQLEQLRGLSEQVLVPNLGAAPDEFYETADDPPGSVRLRPKYGWYGRGMWRLARLARCITAYGDTALFRLGAQPDSSATPVSGDDCGFQSESG